MDTCYLQWRIEEQIDEWKDAIKKQSCLYPLDIKEAQAILPVIDQFTNLMRAVAGWNQKCKGLDDADRAMLLALLEPDTDEAAGE